MSVYKKIIYNDKEYTFKCSAGTDILFKRLFKTDLDAVYKGAVLGIDPNIDIKELMDQARALREGDKKDPEVIRKGLELVKNNLGFLDTTARLIEFVKEFAYITYLEAKYDPKEVSKYLTVEEFTFWLMEMDEPFFRTNSGVFQSFYTENIHQNSTPKN